MKNEKPHRGYISMLLGCYCPRCREGKLFVHHLSFRLGRNTLMHHHCPVCGQVTDIEVGFYYGTGYISYFAALLLSALSFLAWFFMLGFSFHDHRFVWWLVMNTILLAGLQPWLMRFSRIFWLSCFVSYDADWRQHVPPPPERIVKEQMNNW